ncbi:MAG: phosphatidate cytidylyltransferase [Rickettsiales bacterium]|jgi:phosphatidate cytidylyltransferase|nr:phosphatidate cytidylyltransferase [Rickettsiales bacterium]
MEKDKKDNFLARSLSSVGIVLVNLWFIYTESVALSGLFIFALGIFMAFEWGEITRTAANRRTWGLAGVSYIILVLTPLLLIKSLPNGNNFLMFLFLIVWCVDTFAYIFGAKMNCGKHKITKISPKKSYEGLAAGAIAAMFFGYIFSKRFLPEEADLLLFFTPLFCILEQASDITESFLKRTFNTKDSGDFIPGHGGFLDRYDGFLYTSLAFLYILLFS